MRPLATIALLAATIPIGHTTPHEFSQESVHILNAAAHDHTSHDLATTLAEIPSLVPDLSLWLDAIAIGDLPVGESEKRAAITRLMEAALIRGGSKPDSVPLDYLSSGDIAAMRHAVGFPDPADLLLYLLLRGPSLLDSFELGQYTAIRAASHGSPYRILFERSDIAYLDLSPTFRESILLREEDPVSRIPGEQAKTRRFNLSYLPDLVLAAKAFRAAQRAASDRSVYPLLIARRAVNRAFLGSSPVVYSTEWEAVRALRSYSGKDDYIRESATAAEFRIPVVDFSFRLFKDAAATFGNLATLDVDVPFTLWALWREALSLFAYRADARPAFDRIGDLIGPSTPREAHEFALFLHYLPSQDLAFLRRTTHWIATARAALRQNPILTDGPIDSDTEYTFPAQMRTIGRPDIAARFLMDRIRFSRRTGDGHETDHLRGLAPFLKDYCYMISFTMSSTAGWQRRVTPAYNALLDFLHSVDDRAEPTARGEALAYDGTRFPYPALIPEEDCNIIFLAYGVVEHSQSPLMHRTPAEDRSRLVQEIENWVHEAMSRNEPAPSIVPYLKLIWTDWFAQAFEPLRNPFMDASDFRYYRTAASQLSHPAHVRTLADHPAATPHEKDLIELFGCSSGTERF